jgi:hypothetical protein
MLEYYCVGCLVQNPIPIDISLWPRPLRCAALASDTYSLDDSEVELKRWTTMYLHFLLRRMHESAP